MTPREVVELIKVIRACSPAFTAAPGTPAAWAQMLCDIPATDAAAAVHAHFATSGPWIGIADIRRRVLAARNLLPPDPEVAYAQARRMNTWLDRRAGPEPETHPAVYAAAAKRLGGIGWEVLDGPEGYAHKRFVEAYGPISAAAAEKALTTPLPALLAEVNAPKALPAGSGVRPVAPPEALEVDPARVAELRRQITAASVKKTPPSPKADYPPSTDIEKRRWVAELRRWAAEHGWPTGETGAA